MTFLLRSDIDSADATFAGTDVRETHLRRMGISGKNNHAGESVREGGL